MSSFGNISRCKRLSNREIFLNDVIPPLHFNFFYKFDKYLACVSQGNVNYPRDIETYWKIHPSGYNRTTTYLKYFNNFDLNYLKYRFYPKRNHNALIPVQYPTDYYIFVAQDDCKLRIHRKDTLELIEEKNIPCGIANIRAVYPSDTFAYIYSYRDHNMKKVDYFTQTVLEEFGGYGDGATTFKDIVSIAYNGKYIYLADRYNNRILVYDSKQNYTYINTIDFSNVTGIYADNQYLYAARQASPYPDVHRYYIDLYVYDANTFELLNSINGLGLCNNHPGYLSYYGSVNLTKKDEYLYIGWTSDEHVRSISYYFIITQVNGVPIDGSSLNLDFNTSIQMYDINHHLSLNTIPDMYAPNLDLKFGGLEANLNVFNIKMKLEPHLEMAGYHEFITAKGKIEGKISVIADQTYKPNMNLDFNLGIDTNQIINKIPLYDLFSQINCINTCPIKFDSLKVTLKKSVFYYPEEATLNFNIRSIGGHFENIALLTFKSDTNPYYDYSFDIEGRLVQGKHLKSETLEIPFNIKIDTKYIYGAFSGEIPFKLTANGIADSFRTIPYGLNCKISFELKAAITQNSNVDIPKSGLEQFINTTLPEYCEG